MRAAFRGTAALPLVLSTALLVPAVHWCAIPWEQTSLEDVALCSAVPGGICRYVASNDLQACQASSEGPIAWDVADDAGPSGCSQCPLAAGMPDQTPHGRAYILGDSPGGLVIRGTLVPALSPLEAPAPPLAELPISARPQSRPPDPEIRPPAIEWRAVRLARAPPSA